MLFSRILARDAPPQGQWLPVAHAAQCYNLLDAASKTDVATTAQLVIQLNEHPHDLNSNSEPNLECASWSCCCGVELPSHSRVPHATRQGGVASPIFLREVSRAHAKHTNAQQGSQASTCRHSDSHTQDSHAVMGDGNEASPGQWANGCLWLRTQKQTTDHVLSRTPNTQ